MVESLPLSASSSFYIWGLTADRDTEAGADVHHSLSAATTDAAHETWVNRNTSLMKRLTFYPDTFVCVTEETTFKWFLAKWPKKSSWNTDVSDVRHRTVLTALSAPPAAEHTQRHEVLHQPRPMTHLECFFNFILWLDSFVESSLFNSKVHKQNQKFKLTDGAAGSQLVLSWFSAGAISGQSKLKV